MPERTPTAEKEVLPCCRGEGPCQAPPDIGPCDPLPTAEKDAPLYRCCEHCSGDIGGHARPCPHDGCEQGTSVIPPGAGKDSG